MDLVTLTDHDTVAGALEIASLPATFVSEEVSCVLPGGHRLHVGVFGITEAQHEVIARRRTDAEACSRIWPKRAYRPPSTTRSRPDRPARYRRPRPRPVEPRSGGGA